MMIKKMVEKFQCPGCVIGSKTDCGKFKFNDQKKRCTSHVLGTSMGFPGNLIAVRLPKGFCKPGFNDDGNVKREIDVVLWEKGEFPEFDKYNIAVWALENDGFLFVRRYAPRINHAWTDIIEGGKIDMVPGAINIENLLDEMD